MSLSYVAVTDFHQRLLHPRELCVQDPKEVPGKGEVLPPTGGPLHRDYETDRAGTAARSHLSAPSGGHRSSPLHCTEIQVGWDMLRCTIYCAQYVATLFCIVLYSTVLNCTALHCTAPCLKIVDTNLEHLSFIILHHATCQIYREVQDSVLLVLPPCGFGNDRVRYCRTFTILLFIPISCELPIINCA